MLGLVLIPCVIVGAGGAFAAQALSGHRYGWFGLGVFALLGAIAGGLAGWYAADTMAAAVAAACLGSVAGAGLYGAAHEVASPGPPGLAV